MSRLTNDLFLCNALKRYSNPFPYILLLDTSNRTRLWLWLKAVESILSPSSPILLCDKFSQEICDFDFKMLAKTEADYVIKPKLTKHSFQLKDESAKMDSNH